MISNNNNNSRDICTSGLRRVGDITFDESAVVGATEDRLVAAEQVRELGRSLRGLGSVAAGACKPWRDAAAYRAMLEGLVRFARATCTACAGAPGPCCLVRCARAAPPEDALPMSASVAPDCPRRRREPSALAAPGTAEAVAVACRVGSLGGDA